MELLLSNLVHCVVLRKVCLCYRQCGQKSCRLEITTRISFLGFLTPVPGTIAGSFHTSFAGAKSHMLMMAAVNTKISFSANVRPLHIADPEPQGFILPYRAVPLPDLASRSRKRVGLNFSGSAYTEGSWLPTANGAETNVPSWS